VAAIIAAVVLVSGSGAGTGKIRSAVRIDASSRTAVVHYLRSIHVNPRGVVIQRAAHNYAGARCPGKGWSCTSTRHAVVQVANRPGRNVFKCTTARCSVLQISKDALATNTAKCIKTTGLSSSCSITQQSASADNKAVVYQDAGKKTGLTQTAAYSATITQRATGASNKNIACVWQNVNIDASTNLSGKKVAVTVGLEGHQSVSITQDSAHGGNLASSSASTTDCAPGPLTQSQTLTSLVTGTGSVTQNQNAANSGANVSLDIKQNQSASFYGVATGQNDATFSQTNLLRAVANSPSGPVSQTQSSTNGGLLATVNQDSRDRSTASATQTETQCEDAHNVASSSCHQALADPPPAPYSLTQTQIGPVRKGAGPSTQTGNETAGDNQFAINQTSNQDNDVHSAQTNTVQADCTTSGNCAVTQNTNVDGQTSTNVQSGSSVNTSTSCTGSTCTPTAPPTPTITSSPPNPSNSSSATFEFSDTASPVTFLCKLDGGSYVSCTSPQTYTGLADGSHTFSVKANDADGNESGATSYTWTIDTAPTFVWSGSQLTARNVDLTGFGDGGMRGDGTGSFVVSGVPTGSVERAYLYWHGPTNSTDAAANAAVEVNANPVTGTNIGFASDNNWGFQNSQAYRADVTSLVTGNGTYNLTNFLKVDADINGVALIVFYDDGDGANNRNVVLWNGNDSNLVSTFDPANWDETLTGVPYPGSGSVDLDLVVGDGQSFTDAALVVNGSTVATAGPIFEGNVGSNYAGNPSGVTGSLWDIKTFDITSLLTAGPSNTLHVTSATGADALSLVVALADAPASASGPVILSPTELAPQAATAQLPAVLQRPSPTAGAGGIR
jgi:hypothetical protein